MKQNDGRELVIVGASGFALEVFWLAQRAGYKIAGFLDDSEERQNKVILGLKVLGKIDNWANFSDVLFVIAIGSPRVRKQIYERMVVGKKKPEFATLIDPSALLGPNVSFGAGSIICAGVVATVEINAGAHVIVNLNSTIGHETNIGDFVTIAPLAAISGRVCIGELVEVGTGASIKQGVTLGHGSMLGMGGVLTKDIPNDALFFGSPAKFVKTI